MLIYAAFPLSGTSNPNRWASASPQNKERRRWEPPVKKKHPSVGLLKSYSNPMQSQHGLGSVSEHDRQGQSNRTGEHVLDKKGSRLFRTAFRALVRPLKTRTDLRTLYKMDEMTADIRATPTLPGEGLRQVDQDQSQVYQAWINELVPPPSNLPSDESAFTSGPDEVDMNVQWPFID